jgi:hypothetical protein
MIPVCDAPVTILECVIQVQFKVQGDGVARTSGYETRRVMSTRLLARPTPIALNIRLR